MEHHPPTEEQLARQRLAILDAVVLAAERRWELMDVVSGARDLETACDSVAELFGITEPAAQAVLEMRLRLFSQSEVARARVEREDIRARLDRGR